MPNQTLKSSLTAKSLIAYGFSLCLDAERHALAGQCAESNLCYKAALGLFESVLGSKNQLGEAVQIAMRAAKPPCCRTEHTAQRLLPLIDRQSMIMESSRIAGSLQYLAENYCHRGHFDLAAPLVELQLSLHESNSPGSPFIAQTLELLAQCYERTGRGAEAERLRRRAAEIWNDGIPTFS